MLPRRAGFLRLVTGSAPAPKGSPPAVPPPAPLAPAAPAVAPVRAVPRAPEQLSLFGKRDGDSQPEF
jgi:hypothetical protein